MAGKIFSQLSIKNTCTPSLFVLKYHYCVLGAVGSHRFKEV